jgi:DNA-directed RNA polymerase specialized sigma24 family protein
MEALTEAEKETVHLIFNAGLTYAEAAKALEIPEGTVKSRINAIKNKMRRL